MNNRLSMETAAAAVLIPLFLAGGELTAEVTKEKILAAGAEWQENYDKFEPEKNMVEGLKTKLGDEIKIDVYLGLWCSDSRENLPPFMKILDRAGTRAAIRYFNLPRKAEPEKKYYVEDLKVEKVPTFIFYRNGAEIGRIVESPKAGMLEDMMDILFR